jgi:hypothetical protein
MVLDKVDPVIAVPFRYQIKLDPLVQVAYSATLPPWLKVVAPLGVMVVAANSLAATFTPAERVEQPETLRSTV